MKPLAWGRLLRLSLAPSAAADVAAGLCLGGWGVLAERRECLLLVGASLCVYHGGMALNDWADRAGDARTRPDRPIPSGAVAPGAALLVALALLAAGAALAWTTAPGAGLAMTAVAACAAFYDLAGRGPLRGPVLLALCRGGNLASGVLLGARLAVASGAPAAPNLAWTACALYAGYVFFASRLGRLEDDEDPGALGARPRQALLLAASCMLVLPLVALLPLGPLPESFRMDYHAVALAPSLLLRFGLPMLLVGLGAEALLRESARREWTRGLVGRATGLALRRLLIFSAASALVSSSPLHHAFMAGRVVPVVEGLPSLVVGAAIVVAGYPLAFALRRVFPPT